MSLLSSSKTTSNWKGNEPLQLFQLSLIKMEKAYQSQQK